MAEHLNEDLTGLIDTLLSTHIAKFVTSNSDGAFVRLQGSSIEVPSHYFEDAWTQDDWIQLSIKLLKLLPPGSAHAITMARKNHGPNFKVLYEKIGMYGTCPPVVQEAMFFERRDVQEILEVALNIFHTIFTPKEFDFFVRQLVFKPWQLDFKSKLYFDIKTIIIDAEICCVPGKKIQFWNGTGIHLLPSESYVIFCLLLFETGYSYITKLDLEAEGTLQSSLKTVWRKYHHLKTLPTK